MKILSLLTLTTNMKKKFECALKSGWLFMSPSENFEKKFANY